MKKTILLFLLCIFLCGCKAENKTDIEENTETKNQEAESVEASVIEPQLPDDLIIWEEKQVSIEGIDADYNIWFFADSHIIVQDGSESAEVASYATERAAGFENDMGVSSDKIFTEFIDEANKKMPDIVIFGGDIIDFPSEANVAFLQSELARLVILPRMHWRIIRWCQQWEIPMYLLLNLRIWCF